MLAQTALNWQLLFSVANLAITTVITVALFYVGSKAKKIDQLEERLRSAATEAVDLRFGSLAGKLEATVAGLRAIVEEIQRRLQRGDTQFDRANDIQHRLELKTMQQLSELKDQCASKEEVQELRVRHNSLEIKVNTIATTCRSNNCLKGEA